MYEYVAFYIIYLNAQLQYQQQRHQQQLQLQHTAIATNLSDTKTCSMQFPYFNKTTNTYSENEKKKYRN